MSPLSILLLSILSGSVLCQYYDYEGYLDPSHLLGPSGPNCPQNCDCPMNFPSAMYCDGRRLKSIPGIPPGVKYLYLQNNQIEDIKAGAFANVTDLRWLILDNNRIKSSKVEKGAFEKLASLERLLFSYNDLSEPVGPLSKSLVELKMIGNKLSMIPANLMVGLENLTSVHLQENELTTEGLDGALEGLKSLHYLDISHNKLGKLPAGVPKSVQMFYADNNKIASIAKDYLQNLPQLQYLRISHNELADSGIPAGAFNVSSLIELDLSYNKLASIPEVNENLENLYLQVNEISKFDLGSFCKIVGPVNYSKLRHLRLDGNHLTRSSVPFDASNCLRQAAELTVDATD
ncbi:lumican [Anguilla anguilla]|uniref:lumican n=1 Tax=Anguilla anguilla TaxID=7936 RepID=UPI0015B348FA|nr:lumican [Anguilla anguilla]XP_035281032.1 lumican [Anguilla anguilla]